MADDFGTGLVKTAEDFGAQGEYPSHPVLLDRLAKDFVASGWNLQKLIKRIVMSETYQQESKLRKSSSSKDPYNRLLARSPRFRLDAEFVRDSALFASGLLDLEIGGPSVYPYQQRVFGLMSVITVIHLDLHLRNIYLVQANQTTEEVCILSERTSPPPSMTIFDTE